MAVPWRGARLVIVGFISRSLLESVPCTWLEECLRSQDSVSERSATLAFALVVFVAPLTAGYVRA